METYIGISFIIIIVALCVHCVFERGKKIGLELGRHQILLENMIRAEGDTAKQITFTGKLQMIVDNSDNYLEHHEEVQNLCERKALIH